MAAMTALLLSTTPPLQSQDRPDTEIISDVKDMLTLMADYDYGMSRSWLSGFQALMAEAYHSPGALPAIEEQMISFLGSEAGIASKQYICKELGIIGTASSVPVLSAMLKDPLTAGTALPALEKIPAQEAGQALREALRDTGNPNRIAIINSLAARKDEKAVSDLKSLIHNDDPMVAMAAVSALGDIGGKDAAKILGDFSRTAGGDIKWIVLDAQLQCADKLLEDGDRSSALAIYEKVYDADPPVSIKTAALTGKFIAGDEDPADFLSQHLRSEDPAFHRQVISLVRLVPEPQNLGKLFEDVPQLPATSKMYLFVALADASDRSVRQTVLDALKHDDPVIRMAAINSLPKVSEPSDALLLASLAAESRGMERDMARQSLDILQGEQTNAFIIESIGTSEGAVRSELIRSSGERNMTGAADLLLHYSADQDPGVRVESIRALGKLATPEYLPEMITILTKAGSRREQQEAERTILALTGKMPANSNKSADITEILPSVTDENTVISLLSILGNIGDNKDMPIMRTYLSSPSDEVQMAVIRAFSGWPDASPLQDLRPIVEHTGDAGKHSLAMRSYVELIIKNKDMTAAEQFGELKNAFSFAADPGEKKMVLSGLSRIGLPEALEMAMSLLDDPDLRKEAEAAVLRIAENTIWGYPEVTKKHLDKLLEVTDNEQLRSRIKGILQNMDR